MSKVSDWQKSVSAANQAACTARNNIPAPLLDEKVPLARVDSSNGGVELCSLERGRNDFFVLTPKRALLLAYWIITNYGENNEAAEKP